MMSENLWADILDGDTTTPAKPRSAPRGIPHTPDLAYRTKACLYLPPDMADRKAWLTRALDFAAARGLHVEAVTANFDDAQELFRTKQVGRVLVPLRSQLPIPGGVEIVDEYLQAQGNAHRRTKLLRAE